MAVPIDKGATLDINSLWELMNELCDVKKKWKLIGLGLRVPPADLNAMSGDPLECLQNSLSQWLNRINPLPTWDALIAVLRSRVVGEEKKAQELEEKFCRVTPLSDPPTHMQAQKSATMSPPRTQSGTSDGSETSPTHEVTPGKDQCSDNDSFNSSPARPSLRSSLERISDAEVKSKVTQKDTQFRTLVRKTQQHLSRSKKGDFAAFKVAITYMPASPHGHHILLSPDDRNDIMKATSFDQIFVVLNQYWTYSQYELLAYVVQEYGNDGLKEEMKKYRTDMEELEVQISTNHFTIVELCYPRPDSIVIEVHLSGSQHKLHDARFVQLSVAEQCGLHPHTIRTFKCTPDPTVITLLIPYAVAGHVMATLYGMKPAGDLLSKPMEERVVYTMDEAEIEIYLPPNAVPAGVPESAIITGRRERSGLSDLTATITTGYNTLCRDSEEGKEGEPHSETAMLTRVPREREKEAKEFQHTLSKLRSALHDVEEVADKDDHYFLQWLKARKFNVAKAEDMLRKHIDVRKKHKLDTILTDYKHVEVLEKYFPGGQMGEDREGHPVWYDHFSYDFRGLFYSVRMDDIMTLFMYRAELCLQRCAKASVRKGQHIDSITFVIDFDKFSPQRQFYWPGIQMIRKVLSMFEANYPEAAHRVFLIHLHSFFRKYYNLVKGFLHENTHSKIFFLGNDYKEVLLKYISPDQLPKAYGGTRCEPNPYCTEHINPGGDIPEEYYLSNLMESSKKEMERVVVGRRSSYLISYHVDAPGSKLRWDFMTTDHGIKYGWYLKSSNGQRTFDVVPVKKAKSHIIPENGTHICECPGEYVLKFDNSSLIHSKELFYLVMVIPPESDTTPLETEATPTQAAGMMKEGSGGGKVTVKQEGESDMPQSESELSDFEVLAEKVVQVTNEEQHIVWEGYGLRLHIPHNSLPEGVNQCHLKIKVALAENFEVPEDSTLVSAVYSLSHDFGDKELQHPFTLEMQHCANTSALNDLCVVRAIDVSSKFEIFTGGDFTCSGYGAVDLCHFSLFGIILESISLLCFPLKYCAALYYTGIMHRQFDFEVFIIQDLDTQEEAIKNKIRERDRNFVSGPSTKVQFRENEIRLEIPESNCDGWMMTRLNPHLVCREDVAPHKVSVPCKVTVKWAGSEDMPPTPLSHEIQLLGTTNESDFLIVTLPRRIDRRHSREPSRTETPQYDTVLGLLEAIITAITVTPGVKETLSIRFMEERWINHTVDCSGRQLAECALERVREDPEQFPIVVEMFRATAGMDIIANRLEQRVALTLSLL